MKQILIAAVLAAYWQSEAAEPVWLTDLPIAEARARAENKLVLVDFTGSDWCGWCIKFKYETLSTQKFADYAKKNLVLVELDFPRRKAQDPAQKAANQKLKDKYQVRSFPTLLVLKASGKEAWRQVGYMEGGPKAFIAELEKVKK